MNPWPEVERAMLMFGAEFAANGEPVALDRYGSHEPSPDWLRLFQARATCVMRDAAARVGEDLSGWTCAVYRPASIVIDRVCTIVAIDPAGRMHTIPDLARAAEPLTSAASPGA